MIMRNAVSLQNRVDPFGTFHAVTAKGIWIENICDTVRRGVNSRPSSFWARPKAELK